MNIDIASVGVLATIMPIGLLVIGFEIRSVPSLVATGRGGTVLLWWLGTVLVLALFGGFFAEYRMILALLGGYSLGGLDVVLLRWSFALVGSASFLLLLASLGTKLGLDEKLGRRSNARTLKSPRRLARRMKYVEQHHPNWRDSD